MFKLIFINCISQLNLSFISTSDPPGCFRPFVYNIGHVIDIFLYRRVLYNPETYLIIGSISHESHFSLIMFFKEVTKTKFYSKYQYIGEISATLLQQPVFCLSSLAMYNSFLVFSSKSTLFLLDVDNFIAAPIWFNPIQIRSFGLNPIILEFSSSLYNDINLITEIKLVDRCQSYMSIYIITRYSGILMIEINKPSFQDQKWIIKWLFAPLRLNSTKLNNPVDPPNFEPLMLDGRLLFNYYHYDYQSSSVAVNNQAMGILIKHVVMQNFHIYILRVININSHSGSLVYHDFFIQNATECVNLNINEDKSQKGKVEFSALCDATIFRYVVNLKETLVINAMNPYWNDPNAYIVVNITQNSVFHMIDYSSQVKLKLDKKEHDERSRQASSLTIQIIFIVGLIGVSLLTIKIFFSE